MRCGSNTLWTARARSVANIAQVAGAANARVADKTCTAQLIRRASSTRTSALLWRIAWPGSISAAKARRPERVWRTICRGPGANLREIAIPRSVSATHPRGHKLVRRTIGAVSRATLGNVTSSGRCRPADHSRGFESVNGADGTVSRTDLGNVAIPILSATNETDCAERIDRALCTPILADLPNVTIVDGRSASRSGAVGGHNTNRRARGAVERSFCTRARRARFSTRSAITRSRTITKPGSTSCQRASFASARELIRGTRWAGARAHFGDVAVVTRATDFPSPSKAIRGTTRGASRALFLAVARSVRNPAHCGRRQMFIRRAVLRRPIAELSNATFPTCAAAYGSDIHHPVLWASGGITGAKLGGIASAPRHPAERAAVKRVCRALRRSTVTRFRDIAEAGRRTTQTTFFGWAGGNAPRNPGSAVDLA